MRALPSPIGAAHPRRFDRLGTGFTLPHFSVEPLCGEQHWPAQTLPADGVLESRLALEWKGQYRRIGHSVSSFFTIIPVQDFEIKQPF